VNGFTSYSDLESKANRYLEKNLKSSQNEQAGTIVTLATSPILPDFRPISARTTHDERHSATARQEREGSVPPGLRP
jgi:hypothetical protein